MDRGNWWAIVHGVTESDTTEQPSMHIRNLHALGVLSLQAASTQHSLESVCRDWRSLRAATKILWAGRNWRPGSTESVNKH